MESGKGEFLLDLVSKVLERINHASLPPLTPDFETVFFQALIFVMPLLGVGYVMTLLVNPTVRSIGVPLLVAASDAMEAVITSTQGFVISLPYCFLNSEVQGVVRSHWSRWRMVRTVGKNNTTRANSVSTNATYYINQKSGVQVAYQRKNTETI